MYRDLGRLKESVRCGKEAIERMRKLEDPRAESYVLTSLAESYTALGYHSSALTCLKRSLRLRRKIGDREGEAGSLRDIFRVYEALGDTERARGAYEEAESKREASTEVVGISSIAERRS